VASLKRPVVHLSAELQNELDKLNSSVELAATINGAFPDRYAFYGKEGKSFRTEFAATENEFSIVLFVTAGKLKYENCFARGLFHDIKSLAAVIDLWVGKRKDIQEIKTQFDELELYREFETKNANPRVEKAWTKVKNMHFNDTLFWRDTDWNERYLEMITEAKQHPSFQNLFPFTSHRMLRFSVDSELHETWVLGIHIVPTMYSKEVPEILGKFYVSYNDQPMGGRFFNSAKQALDFYAKKLDEIKPIRWVA